MEFEILTVGTELTLGLSIDTNSAYVARRLAREGLWCRQLISVADDVNQIVSAIKESLSRVDLVIITGGLGPTMDDLTRDAVSQAFGLPLIFRPELAEMLKTKFASFDQEMPQLVLRQAYLPKGAEPIMPLLGTAPGIVLKTDNQMIIALPGVPREMEEMLKEVVPMLSRHFALKNKVIVARIIKTYGASEAFIEERVEDIMNSTTNPRLGILAHLGEVHLELMASAEKEAGAHKIIEKTETEILKRLGELVFGFDEDSLESVVGSLLKKHQLRLAVAESCTGGLLGHKLTDVPGSSEYFLGGITAYANEMKANLVGVAEKVLQKFGAVSAETALEMAEGVRQSAGADIGLSTTGIAGPTGGTTKKPVGLVFVGLSTTDENRTERFLFTGPRQAVKWKAAGAALNILRLYLLKHYDH